MSLRRVFASLKACCDPVADWLAAARASSACFNFACSSFNSFSITFIGLNSPKHRLCSDGEGNRAKAVQMFLKIAGRIHQSATEPRCREIVPRTRSPGIEVESLQHADR